MMSLMVYGHGRKPIKYKIVEVIHANGEIDYTIKQSIYPFYFIWSTVEICYGYYNVVMKGIKTLEHAKELVKQYEENDRKEIGERVIKRKNI